MMNILIICTGNTCRSQIGFLQSFDKSLKVFSAGTRPCVKLNQNTVKVMKEIGIDISHHTTNSVDQYLGITWDYVITVCDDAKEVSFYGKVKHRLHIGFDDPWEAKGTEGFIRSEYIRVRDEIKQEFYKFYIEQIKPNL